MDTNSNEKKNAPDLINELLELCGIPEVEANGQRFLSKEHLEAIISHITHLKFTAWEANRKYENVTRWNYDIKRAVKETLAAIEEGRN